MIALLAAALGLALTAASVLIHYEALRLTGQVLPRLPIRPRQRVMVVIAGCMAGHVLEIGLYAGAFAILQHLQVLGGIDGAFDAGIVDFLYFSVSCYTTLGMGDVFAHGPVRIIVGLEALTGFLLITWSASFTYLMMQRYWHPAEDR